MAATQQDLSSAPTPLVNGPLKRRPFWPLEFYRSAVGKKWVMALTGVALLGYVLTHMIGNLHVYEGPAQVNHYAEGLRDIGHPLVPRSLILWGLRIGLLGAFLLHIHAAYALTVMNHRARPEEYKGGRDYVAANFASRTMRWTGVIVLLYVVFHLADLTWGTPNPDYVRGDPYHNLVASFERPVVAIFYIAANLALGVHIFHGAWSLFQSLGINNPRFNKWRLWFARGFATLIVAGNVTFPIMVLAGLVDEDNRDTPIATEVEGETASEGTDA
jgi:succinate dehydrogenase / fumarate reductase, cytochrome b subunit